MSRRTQNFVRKHVLANSGGKWRQHRGCGPAGLQQPGRQLRRQRQQPDRIRRLGNEDELGKAYISRKGFAYGVDGKPARNDAVLTSVLGTVKAAYQNLESLELGVTSVDHYFDGLGGLTRAITAAQGEKPALYIGDQTRGAGKIRTLNEQVALEIRTRTLNPKYIEDLLAHGHEGVRQIESQVTNTLGWSATTGTVDPWVYRQITETFVLDKTMRDRLAALNPTASARLTNRLIEAQERNYWLPDEDTLEALKAARRRIGRPAGRPYFLAVPVEPRMMHLPPRTTLRAGILGVCDSVEQERHGGLADDIDGLFDDGDSGVRRVRSSFRCRIRRWRGRPAFFYGRFAWRGRRP
jgi:magnesium chelatase subunit H